MPKYSNKSEQQNQVKVVETPTPDTIKEVNIQSLIDSHLIYTGRESGRLYEWAKAGSIIPVLEEDVPELLAKHLGGKTCCGNEDNKIFQIAP